jgi:hypothetical protein
MAHPTAGEGKSYITQSDVVSPGLTVEEVTGALGRGADPRK